MLEGLQTVQSCVSCDLVTFQIVMFYLLCNDLSRNVLFVQTGSVEVLVFPQSDLLIIHSEDYFRESFTRTDSSLHIKKPEPHHNTTICIMQNSRKKLKKLLNIFSIKENPASGEMSTQHSG